MGTLYLTEQGSTVTKTGERLVVRKDGELLCDVPALQVDQIVVFGNAAIPAMSTWAMRRFLAWEPMPLAFASTLACRCC